MSNEPTPNELYRSLQGHIRLCYLLIFGLFGGLVAWAYATEISGSVIAGGTIAVETSVKNIQHPDGGVVKKILVRNGDYVQAGDALVILDDAAILLSYNLARTIYVDSLMTRARLEADLSDSPTITVPTELADFEHPELVRAALAEQTSAMQAGRAAKRTEIAALKEQISQLELQRKTALSRDKTFADELAILDRQLANAQTLFDKHLYSGDRLDALKRDRTRTLGSRQANAIDADRVLEAISERRISIEKVHVITRAKTEESLVALKSDIDRLIAEMANSRAQLDRIVIRAPEDGVIHNISIHTIGAVIRPADSVVQIVPVGDDLVLDLKIRPTDVDHIFPGQHVSVQFPGLNHRTVPRLNARVTVVSADLLEDSRSGATYYTVSARLDPGEAKRLGKDRLLPGMPAVGFIEVKQRTVADYLVGPLLDQLEFAMKEE